MKRFLKWSLILGLVFCLLGVGVITAGAMMGGGLHLGRHLTRTELWDKFSDSRRTTPYTETAIAAVPGSQELPLTGGYSYEQVRELKLELFGNRVELLVLEDVPEGTIQIGHASHDEAFYQIYQDGDELKIEAGDNRLSGEALEPLLIHVPQGFLFDEIEIENAGGSFYANQIQARELSVECAGGDIEIGGGSVQKLSLECSAGQIRCEAVTGGSADVECASGDIAFTLAGPAESHVYDMECAMGHISVGGQDYQDFLKGCASRHSDAHQRHHQEPNVELECAAGSITVNFQEPGV